MNPEQVAVEIRRRVRAGDGWHTAALRTLRREFTRRLAAADAPHLLELARRLVSEPEFLYRFLAYELIAHHPAARTRLRSRDVTALGRNLDSWGAVDTFACYISGPAWRDGQVPDALIHRWALSPDRWLRRAALVSTVPLNCKARGGAGDSPRTLAVCTLLVGDRDDMVVKAMSWALRELAKHDATAAEGFLAGQGPSLAPRVIREVRNKLRTGLKNPRRRREAGTAVKDPVERLIADFRRLGRESDPKEQALRIAKRSPEGAAKLARRVVDELPEGGTFHHAVLSFVPLEEWPGLVEHAIAAFDRDRKNAAAEAVFEYASLQCVRSLHPHLETLFTLSPNDRAYFADWLWRGAGRAAWKFLLSVVDDRSAPPGRRTKAWRCLLETRKEPAVRSAVELAPRMRRRGLLGSADVTDYLHEVGFERKGPDLRKLCSDKVYHFGFVRDYVVAGNSGWRRPEDHPTWLVPPGASAGAVDFGGEGSARCGRCGHPTHRLARFGSARRLSFVKGLRSLTIETCLSCLGWEEEEMFFRHDAAGRPTSLSGEGPPPKFPVGALKETGAVLVDLGDRWRWQDWAMSNGRENLNRVGGHPTWIQSAEYLQCPDCGVTMTSLLQLDSYLPTRDGRSWLWGSGGIVYVFWCAACRVSGMLWQCT